MNRFKTQSTLTDFQRNTNSAPWTWEGNIKFCQTGQRSRNYELNVAWWVWWGKWRTGSNKWASAPRRKDTWSVMEIRMTECKWYLINLLSYIFIYSLDGKKETGRNKEQKEVLGGKWFPWVLAGKAEGRSQIKLLATLYIKRLITVLMARRNSRDVGLSSRPAATPGG